MKRRELIKSMGLASLVGTSALWLYGCEKDPVEPMVEEELSERDKLIINRDRMSISDPNNPTDFELTHLPNIDVLNTDSLGFTRVDISMGSQGFIHGISDLHWNDYIKLFLDGELVAHNQFEVNIARGFSSFFVPLEGVNTVSVEIGCNLHGIWENVLSL